MKAIVKIEATNVIGEGQASIDVTVQADTAKCFDAKNIIKSILKKMLSCREIMDTFNLCYCGKEDFAKCMSDINDNEFKVDMQVEKNDIIIRPATLGPRPNIEVPDTSTRLCIYVRFQEEER